MIPQDALIAASKYCLDHGVKLLQGFRLADTDEAHIEALLKFMRPDVNSLWVDVGCGFGEAARLMCEQRPDLSFFLVNNNQFQLSHAPEDFRAIYTDMDNIPLGDATVDGCMFLYSLCHSGDIIKTLTEAARLTIPGGSLFVFDYERMRGDNEIMLKTLYAQAWKFSELYDLALEAGWRIVDRDNPDGSDAVFRSICNDEETYDKIFGDLTPVVWKAVRQ